jgi:hypothetical protein
LRSDQFYQFNQTQCDLSITTNHNLINDQLDFYRPIYTESTDNNDLLDYHTFSTDYPNIIYCLAHVKVELNESETEPSEYQCITSILVPAANIAELNDAVGHYLHLHVKSSISLISYSDQQLVARFEDNSRWNVTKTTTMNTNGKNYEYMLYVNQIKFASPDSTKNYLWICNVSLLDENDKISNMIFKNKTSKIKAQNVLANSNNDESGNRISIKFKFVIPKRTGWPLESWWHN